VPTNVEEPALAMPRMTLRLTRVRPSEVTILVISVLTKLGAFVLSHPVFELPDAHQCVYFR
jgi:hypothetical protein